MDYSLSPAGRYLSLMLRVSKEQYDLVVIDTATVQMV